MRDKEVVVYDMDYLDIPLQDLPPIGNFIVCKDPQKRLWADTWAVLKVISEGDPAHALGLFWDKEEALIFANVKAKEGGPQ